VGGVAVGGWFVDKMTGKRACNAVHL
jgi:hypothetical protein